MEQDTITDETHVPSAPPSRWLAAPLLLSVCVTIFVFAYAVSERRHAARLAAENSQLAATLSQTQSQVDALGARLSAMMSAQAPPSPAPEQPKPEETHRPAQAGTTHKARRPRAVENQSWKKIENQLAEQQKAIATTQQDLEKTRTELEGKLTSTHDEVSGSIAKTHDELVALERKGERKYYEFDLEKSKQFQHVGPLSLSLRKTNTKHEHYDMAMVVDDRELNKKHVNLYEPVWIYPADSHQPVEVVVNRITKDGVHGYVSAPKHAESENAAAGTEAGTESAATSSTSGANGPSTPNEGSSATRDSLSHRPPEEPR
jgi:hypothetical protein